jgi:proteasome lid subunit RPN8/RPN11
MNASTVTTPRCDATVFLDIQEHACSETDREVGGVLVGHLDDADGSGGAAGSAVVSASIPALKAVGGSANVTFTHEVWEEALTIVDRDYPGERIIGWYHSHPGFGVFLSDYDQFIQRNFFGGEGMVALVVDPLGGEGGWFVTVGDDIEELPTFAMRSVPRSAAGGAASSTAGGAGAGGGAQAGQARRSQALLYGSVAGVAAFAIGWFLAPDGSDTSSTTTDSEVAALESERDALLEALDEATTRTGTTVPAEDPASDPAGTPPPSGPWDLRYVVRPGDNISVIAQRFYGTSEAVPGIIAANPHIPDPNLISAGDELLLPGALARGDDGLPVLDTWEAAG